MITISKGLRDTCDFLQRWWRSFMIYLDKSVCVLLKHTHVHINWIKYHKLFLLQFLFLLYFFCILYYMLHAHMMFTCSGISNFQNERHILQAPICICFSVRTPTDFASLLLMRICTSFVHKQKNVYINICICKNVIRIQKLY